MIPLSNHAALYARFSSDNQRTESIDAQLRAMRAYCEQHNFTIVNTYVDEARSATNDRRPSFQQMIADSASKTFNILLVHKLDRFARNRYDSAIYKRELKKNGVTVYSVLENLDSSPESIIMESVLEGMSEYYSQNLAREVRKGMKETALQCKHNGGVPPLGYDLDPISRELVMNEAEAETVRLIYNMYGAGRTYGEILKALHERGALTKAGREFQKTSLNSILTNQKYAGNFVFNRCAPRGPDGTRNSHRRNNAEDVITVAGGCPQIVDADTFRKVSERMSSHNHDSGRRYTKHNYLLSGKKTQTVTQTTTDAEGNETVEQTVTTENLNTEGSTGTTVTDGEGNVLSQEIVISQQATERAHAENRPAQAPLRVTPVPEDKVNSTPPIHIRMPAMLFDKDGDDYVTVSEMPKVEIQVTRTGPSIIGMIMDTLGRFFPVKESREGSIIVPVNGSGELVIADNPKEFTDVSAGSWYRDYVTFVAAREIFNGTGSGKFQPDQAMTRAMLAQVLYNFARDSAAGGGTVFSDVADGDWFNAAIGWAYEKGVVNGYGSRFGSQDSITRQDLATILYRYAKAAGYDVSAAGSLSSFPDAGKVSDYAKEALQWAVGAGLVNGMDDGTLNPLGNATRAQVAAIMTRFVREVR